MNYIFRFSTCKFSVLLTSVCLAMASHSIVVSAAEQTDMDKLERQTIEERERLDALEGQLKRLKSNAKGDTKENT